MKESKPVLMTDAICTLPPYLVLPFYLPAPYSPAKSRISMYVVEPMNRTTGSGRKTNDVSTDRTARMGKQEAEKQATYGRGRRPRRG